MQVTLINFTGAGFPDPAKEAAAQMVFTKQTRLTMSPGLLDEIRNWEKSKMHEELAYMANTIPSSWEFCDYTFLIEGVSRAYTHQQVRTRTGSYAQQTMRVLDVSEGAGWDYVKGPSIVPGSLIEQVYDNTMDLVAGAYKMLIEAGAKVEDARGVLPTNIQTNIVVKFNMRTFVETVRKRSSPRTQGEFRAVLDAMYEQVKSVHPWINLFTDRTFDKAAKELDCWIARLHDRALISSKEAADMQKLVDQMRAQS